MMVTGLIHARHLAKACGLLFALITCVLSVFEVALEADPAWYVDGTSTPSETELTISPASPVQAIGSTVTLTSTTIGIEQSGVTVSFYVDQTLIGTALSDTSSQASFVFATPLLAEGQHNFRAEFPDTVTATRLLGTHVGMYVNDVFVGYYDLYERDLVTASSGQLRREFQIPDQPLVFSQPTNQIVLAGADIMLGVGVAGAAPLSYQWWIGERPLTGETNATLTLESVRADQAGTYSVVAANLSGTNASSHASLTVYTVSSSLLPPDSSTVDEGSTVTFDVNSFGMLPLSFQWRHTGTNIPGATFARLSLTNTRAVDAGTYSVEISDGVVSVLAPIATLAVQLKGVSLSSGTWLPDLGFQFTFEGRLGFNHVIALSTNLVDWTELTNVYSVGELISVMDFDAARYPLRFYRVGAASTVQPFEDLVWISPGTFTMGSPAEEADRGAWEDPQTQVTLTHGFLIGIHEVTQGEYWAVVGSSPSYNNGDSNLPVEQVSWDDALDYCAELTKRERAAGRLPAGYVYRLPTEAEWEYASRAGSTTRFSYGDDPAYTNLTNYAWYGGNSGGWTHLVGQKLANAWGLYDMHGNVGEWCQDWYGRYPGGDAIDPQGPAAGSFRVVRGGSIDWFGGAAAACRSASRSGMGQGSRSRYFGFRVVLALSQQ